jgi:ABC-type branched-subunit amino acid transport system ATPase component
MPALPALLETSVLSRRYGGLTALDSADIAVQAGTITGVIGPNGAGKSTLFNVISGQIAPSAGHVRLNGADVTGFTPDRLVSRGLVRTFQLARGFPKLTVFDHLLLYGQRQPGEGLRAALFGSRAGQLREEELAARAQEIAARLNLVHVLANPVTALSGGQKKLLEIGRALMAEPALILLDEPMAGVNPTLAQEIASHLKAIRDSGVTIVLIEHDMVLVRALCDPVIVMVEGRKLTEGSFAAVTADERVQDAYLGRRR